MIKNSEKIKESVTIADVLAAEGYPLDSRNKCACPVHGGKGKNFSVKNDIGTCWSQCSNQSWDAVGLVMELRKMTYPEALEEMARIGNVTIEYEEGRRTEVIEQARLEKSEKDKLYEAMQHVTQLYAKYQEIDIAHGDVLVDGQITRVDIPFDYTKEYTIKEAQQNALLAATHRVMNNARAYSVETIKEFGIFYSGENQVLQKPLSSYIEHLLKLGVVVKKDSIFYEPFRNRILFSIKDERGRVCALAGRKMLSDTSEYPKWLNSKESLIYNKSQILYGLFQTKKFISKNRTAFLVEGYMDLLTMFEFGIKNVVAGCGTAFTYQQVNLLKKYADRVILLYDADDAGKKAAQKATEVLISVGLHADVVLLPVGEDPDSILRRHKIFAEYAYEENKTSKELAVNTFNNYINKNIQDAVTWVVLDGYKKEDMFSQNIAQEKAVMLISKMPKKDIADTFTTQLAKKIGITRAHLVDKVKEVQGKKLDKKHNDKTMEQQMDITEYGLFIENNRYYMCNDAEHLGQEVSNFIIKPLMLIIGSDRSWRLVEVLNDKGRRFIADIDSDAFVDIAGLKKELERRGNYIYKGKPEYFTRIKSKIYNETQECYPINTLGWHNAGFWVWGNGITSQNEFKPVNEYGIVEHGENKYFLPAFAKVKTGSDEEENSFEDEREFIYVQGQCISFQEWTRRMVDVHGSNGMMGVAYYCASLYRDIIYSKFNYFPHLNLFGPPGSGKSFMAWSLAAMYGKAKTPFHLVQGTQVGFFRRLAKSRNAISWYDEYSNDVDFKRVEALKAAYDGMGHEKGDKDNENNVKRTKVKSACMITGQQQPTQDVALFKRCISLNFKRFEKDDERDRRGRDLKTIEQQSRLGQITSLLIKYRANIEDEFSLTFDKVRADVSPAVAQDKTVEDRILNNHLITLTVYKILSQHLEFSFDYEEFKEFVISNILEQSAAINNQDEVSSWWRMFNYLVEMDMLKHDVDFIVQELDSVTIMQKGAKGTATKDLKSKKTVLFLRFEKSYPLYLEYHKRQYSKNGLPETSLKHYLKGYDSFIGEVKAKKFAGQTKYCWAFDMDEIGLNLPLTKLFLDQKDADTINPIKDTAEAVAAMKSIAVEDLPF